MKSLTVRIAVGIFVAALLNVYGQTTPCVDDNAGLAALAQKNGIDNISGCEDVSCALSGQQGAVVQSYCCATCSDAGGGQGETVLPGSGSQVDLFLLAGQSNCVGAARVSDLESPSMVGEYPELQGEQGGVWFAGYQYVAGAPNPSTFFINKLMAGRDRSKFGPEISLGQRIHSVTGRPTMVVKYCVGATNAYSNWNPDTAANGWDKAADDGTAAWLKNNAGLDFASKDTLFKNMVYTMRRTMETLDGAGVPYKWRAIAWVQGQGDRSGWFNNHDEEDGFWQQFGQDTARVWLGFKAHMGLTAAEQERVAILDSGGSASSEMISGKFHAIDLMPGCLGVNVDIQSGCMDPASTCFQTATETCLGNGFSLNWDLFNYYGYDPNFPQEDKPAGASSQEFLWFAEYPVNQHFAVEGQIMLGRNLADAYIDRFSGSQLPGDYRDGAAMKFPIKECGAQVQSCSGDNLCYVEKRTEPGCKQPLAPTPANPSSATQSPSSTPKVSSATANNPTCSPSMGALIAALLATLSIKR